ncbi:MAG: heme o synthase [Antarcticimicrobium sp.]|uniref:heme o synthase n=1 Tax=Antarcticimicrobium sp. TaxID=2824147 RepID=UPI00261AA99A|nr:heme o synthase [Antarcticimicrobium sp.]MDF1717734.1 heme o synthase [Antarcticimicrobium sp.]
MLAALNMTVSILKLRIGAFIALAALVGVMTGGGELGTVKALVFALAVLGASGAAGGFNQYYERERDRMMARTRNRPFASGVLKSGPIWPITLLVLLSGALVMAWSVGGTLATVLVFLGALTYGVIYTVLLKTRTVWNVVIGGAAGSFAVLAGAAATAPHSDPVIGPIPIILAAVLFLWTPPHFWSLAVVRGEDYRRAGIPMLPVVTEHKVWGPVIFSHVVTLVALSLMPLWFGLGWIYGVFAVAGGVPFLLSSWRLLHDPSRGVSMRNFRASLAQFALLSAGVILDEGWRWAF